MSQITIKQAVDVIDQAMNVASSKGAFLIKDAAVINVALEFLKEYIKEPEVLDATPILE